MTGLLVVNTYSHYYNYCYITKSWKYFKTHIWQYGQYYMRKPIWIDGTIISIIIYSNQFYLCVNICINMSILIGAILASKYTKKKFRHIIGFAALLIMISMLFIYTLAAVVLSALMLYCYTQAQRGLLSRFTI